MTKHASHYSAQPRPKLLELHALICAHPGLTIAALARLLDASYPTTIQRLASLEAQGLLVSEDEHGCLYPFS